MFTLNKFSLFNIYLLSSVVYSLQEEWDYTNNGPDYWGKDNEICSSGQGQSPINIVSKLTKLGSNTNLVFTKHKEQIDVVVINEGNGLSFQIILNDTNNTNFESDMIDSFPFVSYIKFSGSSIHYDFKKFTLHWGTSNTSGSEHSIDNEFATAEAQFFYEIFVEDYSVGINKLIVAFLLKVSSQNKSKFSSIFSALNYELPSVSSGKDIRFNLAKLMNIDDDEKLKNFQFYSYIGSLTTPPCSEPVRWIVAKEQLTISLRELNILRSLRTSSGITLESNRRPLQSFNNREVERNFKAGSLKIELHVTLLFISQIVIAYFLLH